MSASIEIHAPDEQALTAKLYEIFLHRRVDELTAAARKKRAALRLERQAARAKHNEERRRLGLTPIHGQMFGPGWELRRFMGDVEKAAYDHITDPEAVNREVLALCDFDLERRSA